MNDEMQTTAPRLWEVWISNGAFKAVHPVGTLTSLGDRPGLRTVPVVPCDEAAIELAARAMFDDWVASDYSYTGAGEWAELDDELQGEWRTSAANVLRAAGGIG